MAQTITKIVIHCSATPNGRRIGNLHTLPEVAIDRWHKSRHFRRRQWRVNRFNPHLKHIGYHFVIGIDGRVGTGRAVGEQGAHVRGHNKNSVGICLVGTDAFTLEQWDALYTLINKLSQQYPEATLHGHRDFSPDLDGDGTVEPHEFIKTCPGFDVTEWVDNDFTPWAENVCRGRS